MTVSVTLDEYEIQECIDYALLFESESKRIGCRNKYGCDGKDSVENMILAMIGECVVSKYLGLPFSPKINTFKEVPDLPGDIEVRSRKKRWYDLIVRNDDPDYRKYVLVTRGMKENEFEIPGFIPGWMAKKAEWIRDYGSRPPAYFIPRQSLIPIGEL